MKRTASDEEQNSTKQKEDLNKIVPILILFNIYDDNEFDDNGNIIKIKIGFQTSYEFASDNSLALFIDSKLNYFSKIKKFKYEYANIMKIRNCTGNFGTTKFHKVYLDGCIKLRDLKIENVNFGENMFTIKVSFQNKIKSSDC